MPDSPLKGKRYINLLRCSTAKQGDKSIPDQKKVNDTFAREHGMIFVRDVELPGISASKVFNRRDLDSLVEHARRRQDFDVLLVHDLSRLTRGGIRHANKVRRQFERVHVWVVSASDAIPEGDDGEFWEAFLHWKNKGYAKNLAREAARGSRSSLENGKRPHASRTPYGFDRLYSGPDGSPRYILRQVDSRTRVVIDYASREIRDTLYTNEFGHFTPFQKQRDETSMLIIGDPNQAEAVRLAFTLRYSNPMRSFKAIAQELTKRGFKPLNASYWYDSSISYIVRNPIYLGRTVACRYAYGVHYVLAANRPQPTPIDQTEYEDGGRLTIDPIHRPRDEWFERDEPQLMDFIVDPLIRARAAASIERDNESFVQPRRKRGAHFKSGGSRGDQRHTPYILRDILRSRDGQFAMTGRTQGHQSYARRTYVVKEFLNGNPAAAHLSAYVPAAQVESVVLAVLRSTFSKYQLRNLIAAAVRDHLRETKWSGADVEALVAEDNLLAKRARALISVSPDPEAPDVQRQLKAWKLRRDQINRQLNAIRSHSLSVNSDELVKSVFETIFTPEDQLDGESNFCLRQVVNAWCFNMIVDTTTRDLEFSVGIPPMWALEALSSGEELCKQYEFACEFEFGAQGARHILTRIRCTCPNPGKPRRRWPQRWSYQWTECAPIAPKDHRPVRKRKRAHAAERT